jgi:hypothetical protein
MGSRAGEGIFAVPSAGLCHDTRSAVTPAPMNSPTNPRRPISGNSPSTNLSSAATPVATQDTKSLLYPMLQQAMNIYKKELDDVEIILQGGERRIIAAVVYL